MLSIVKIVASVAVLSTLAVAAPVRDLVVRDSAPSCTDSDFVAAALDQLNAHRKNHGSPPLEYSSTLAKYAQGVSDTCVMEHSGGPYGENLYMIMPGVQDPYPTATKEAIFSWAKEIQSYDYNSPGFSMNTGHATALLWKSTKKVGCAWTACSDSAMFTCNFDDAVPNMGGEYEANVLPFGTPVS